METFNSIENAYHRLTNHKYLPTCGFILCAIIKTPVASCLDAATARFLGLRSGEKTTGTQKCSHALLTRFPSVYYGCEGP